MKLSKEKFDRIKAFIEEHKDEKVWYQKYIADEFDVCRNTIYRINRAATYEEYLNYKPEKYEELVKRLSK